MASTSQTSGQGISQAIRDGLRSDWYRLHAASLRWWRGQTLLGVRVCVLESPHTNHFPPRLVLRAEGKAALGNLHWRERLKVKLALAAI